jgi:hypothetical protein
MSNKHCRVPFRSTFQVCESRIWAKKCWKVRRTHTRQVRTAIIVVWGACNSCVTCHIINWWVRQTHRHLVTHVYAPQTKILDDRTNISERFSMGSTFQLFVSHRVLTPLKSASRTLCSPNEDCGRLDQPFRMGFRSTFQRFVAQIEYSRPWKVLRKSAFRLLFLLPKSSFGEHKLVLKCLFGLPKSSFERVKLLVRQTHRHAIIIFWFRQAHHLVSSTDTSTSLCSQNEDFGRGNLVSSTDTLSSSCDLDDNHDWIIMRSSLRCRLTRQNTRLARTSCNNW